MTSLVENEIYHNTTRMLRTRIDALKFELAKQEEELKRLTNRDNPRTVDKIIIVGTTEGGSTYRYVYSDFVRKPELECRKYTNSSRSSTVLEFCAHNAEFV